jgi:WD40 repeat protein
MRVSQILHRMYLLVRRPIAYAFGVDVFISYTRDGGSQYAQSLANRLEEDVPGLACYLDRRSARSPMTLPLTLRYQALMARMLVVVASPAVGTSPGVKEEIRLFASLGAGHSIFIDVDGTLKALNWRSTLPWEQLGGGDPEPETRKQFETHMPSPSVLARIRDSVRYGVRARRQKNITLAVALLLVGAVATVFFAERRTASALAETKKEQERAEKAIGDSNAAEQRTQRAEIETRNAARTRDLETVRAIVATQRREQADLAANRARIEADTEWRRAQAARLATESMSQLGRSNPLALLLAAASFDAAQGEPSFDTRSALLRALHFNSGVERYLMMPDDDRMNEVVRSGEEITDIAISGDLLASATKSGTLRLWDRNSGNRVRDCSVPSGLPISAIAFSPSGNRLAATFGYAAIIFSVPQCRALGRFNFSEGYDPLGVIARALRFADDDRLLVAHIDAAGVVAEWNVRDPAKAVRSLAFDADQLSSPCLDSNTMVSDAVDPDLPFLVRSLYAFAFDEDGRHVAIGHRDGRIVSSAWPPDERPRCSRPGAARVTALQFVRSDLWSGDANGVVRKTTGQETQERRRCSRAVWRLAVRDDDGTCVCGGVIQRAGHATKYSANVMTLAWLDGDHFATGNADGSIVFWSAKSPSPLVRHLSSHAAVRLHFTSDGSSLDVHTGERRSIVQIADGRAVDAPTAEDAAFWTPLDERILRHQQYMCCTGGRLMSGNARVAVALMQSRNRRGGYRLLQMEVGGRGERVTDLSYPELRFFATSFDGAMVAAAASSGMVVVVSPTGKRLIHTNSWVYGMALSPSGDRLAILGESGIDLFDVGNGGLIGTLPVPETEELPRLRRAGMAFSPDGRILAASNTGGIDLWDVDVHRWRDLAVQIAGRELTRAERQIHVATR